MQKEQSWHLGYQYEFDSSDIPIPYAELVKFGVVSRKQVQAVQKKSTADTLKELLGPACTDLKGNPLLDIVRACIAATNGEWQMHDLEETEPAPGLKGIRFQFDNETVTWHMQAYESFELQKKHLLEKIRALAEQHLMGQFVRGVNSDSLLCYIPKCAAKEVDNTWRKMEQKGLQLVSAEKDQRITDLLQTILKSIQEQEAEKCQKEISQALQAINNDDSINIQEQDALYQTIVKQLIAWTALCDREINKDLHRTLSENAYLTAAMITTPLTRALQLAELVDSDYHAGNNNNAAKRHFDSIAAALSSEPERSKRLDGICQIIALGIWEQEQYNRLLDAFTETLAGIADETEREQRKLQCYERLSKQLPQELLDKLAIKETTIGDRLLYSPGQIAVGSLFGTMLAGLLMLIQNFMALKQREDAKPFLGLFIILLPVVIYVYATPRSYPALYPFVSAIIMYMIASGVQGELLEARLRDHNRYRQRWIVPIFLGTVIMLVIIAITSVVKLFL